MSLVLPKIFKNSAKKLKKSVAKEEMESDDEDYIAANKRTACHKGYSSANFLIQKYVNKIKYCFDKNKILSAENYL